MARHEVDVAALAAGDGVEIEDRHPGGDGLRRRQPARLRDEQIRRLQKLRHALRVAQHPHARIVHERRAALAVEPPVAAADHDEQVILAELLADDLRRAAQRTRAHAAAGEHEDMAATDHVELHADGFPIRGRGELRRDGDPRGIEPVRGQTRRGKLLRKQRVRDADPVHHQLRDAGRAGVIRRHEIRRQIQSPPGELRHHHRREHMHADDRLRTLLRERLPQRKAPLAALLIQQHRRVLLLVAVARTVELRRVAVGEVVPAADEPGRGRGEKVECVVDFISMPLRVQLAGNRRRGGVVPAAGIAGENGDVHVRLRFSASLRRRGRL